MNKSMLPADGGLKEQVRPFEQTLSVWSIIFKQFFSCKECKHEVSNRN